MSATAEVILIAHQRRDIHSCLCGWADLGKSHPAHQVAMLAEAGLLGADSGAADACPDHKLVQHRDGKPPWCRRCGRDEAGHLIGTAHPKED